MSVLQKSRLTSYGLHRIAQAHAGERMLFTSIGLGDEALEGDLNEVAELTGEKQRFPIAGSKVSGNNFWASCKPTGIHDPEGIYVRAIGLYIADPDPENESDRSNDKLYAVSSVIPDFDDGAGIIAYIPHDQTNAEFNYEIRISTIISSTALIEIVGGIGSLGIATETELGLHLSNSEIGNVSTDSRTGIQTANGLREAIADITSLIDDQVLQWQKINNNANGLEKSSSAIEALWADQALQWKAINALGSGLGNVTNDVQENPFLLLLNDMEGWEIVAGVWDEARGRLGC